MEGDTEYTPTSHECPVFLCKPDYLIDFPDPAVNAVKRPAVRDIIH